MPSRIEEGISAPVRRGAMPERFCERGVSSYAQSKIAVSATMQKNRLTKRILVKIYPICSSMIPIGSATPPQRWANRPTTSATRLRHSAPKSRKGPTNLAVEVRFAPLIDSSKVNSTDSVLSGGWSLAHSSIPWLAMRGFAIITTHPGQASRNGAPSSCSPKCEITESISSSGPSARRSCRGSGVS